MAVLGMTTASVIARTFRPFLVLYLPFDIGSGGVYGVEYGG